jgi:mercuric reductase
VWEGEFDATSGSARYRAYVAGDELEEAAMHARPTQHRFRLRVSGMTCPSCEHHIERALASAGAHDVKADFRRGEVVLSTSDRPDERRLTQAVDAAGYMAGSLEPLSPTSSNDLAGDPMHVITHARAEPLRVRRGSPQRLDVAIVGSGGGAFAAAIAATERGARAVMIERGTLGATCVNIGCIPSKTQLHAGELFWQAGHRV